MASVEESLVARLNTDTTLTALLTDGAKGIYPEYAPNDAGTPGEPHSYITYAINDDDPVNSMSGCSGSGSLTFEVECWASSYSAAKAIADAVSSRLTGWSDTGGTPRIDPVLRTDETDRSDRIRDEEDELVYRITQDYSVWYDLTP